MKKIVIYLLAGFPLLALAQQYPNKSSLVLEEIMKGYDFIGHEPLDVFWSVQGDTLFYQWKEAGEKLNRQFAYVPSADTTLELSFEQRAALSERRNLPDIFSDKYDVVSTGGSVKLWDPHKEEVVTLYDKVGDISRLVMDQSGTGFYYLRGGDWYHHDIPSGKIKRLTRIERGNPEPTATWPDSWIAREELTLFEFLDEKKSNRESQKAFRDTMAAYRDTLPVIYMNKKNFNHLGITPDGKTAFIAITERSDPASTQVPDWITAEGEVKMLQARAKVGQYPPGQELMVIDVASGSSFTLQLKDLEGIYDKPLFLKEYTEGNWSPLYEKHRDIGIQSIQISEDGQVIVADLIARDNKDRWLIRILPSRQTFTLVDRQRDEAWIGGPGVRTWGSSTSIGFVPGTHTLYYQSEKEGYSHVYTYDFDTELTAQITGGNYEVHRIAVSRDNKSFYLKANKEDPGMYHWYKVGTDGKGWEQLTFAPGNWDLLWDKRETAFAALYSTPTQPKEIYLQKGSIWERITRSQSESFNAYNWRTPEFVRFSASDGALVPARLYRPEAGSAGSPAVIFVHGAGYLQNAHKYWSTYYREYMFHNFLVDNGFTVLDIDYRGSAGYGRDWRTGIYRHMGGKDLSDHVDGVKFLTDSLGVDPGKVGIYGGSYGGFITLMAMFNHPESFTCGAALRSVTDWAHYNHGYTANILNTPEQDPEAFRRSSPIYFAEGLQGHLLILHGMVDVNVQVQDVVRLSQRLIELGKDNWEMALYPVEDHGFTETYSWLDEYKRIYKLFYERLR